MKSVWGWADRDRERTVVTNEQTNGIRQECTFGSMLAIEYDSIIIISGKGLPACTC